MVPNKIKHFIEIILFLLITQLLFAQTRVNIPKRPKNFKPYIYKYSTSQLTQFTKQHVENAKQAREDMDKVIFEGPYKASFASLSNHSTPEWYMDGKFGIMFNYGIYSVAGYGTKGYGGNYYTDFHRHAVVGQRIYFSRPG